MGREDGTAAARGWAGDPLGGGAVARVLLLAVLVSGLAGGVAGVASAALAAR